MNRRSFLTRLGAVAIAVPALDWFARCPIYKKVVVLQPRAVSCQVEGKNCFALQFDGVPIGSKVFISHDDGQTWQPFGRIAAAG